MASGVSRLDLLLDGLYIGDNVVWHDDAGSLALVFCLNFLQASEAQNKPFIYVSFDRSPKTCWTNWASWPTMRNLPSWTVSLRARGQTRRSF